MSYLISFAKNHKEKKKRDDIKLFPNRRSESGVTHALPNEIIEITKQRIARTAKAFLKIDSNIMK